MRPSLKLFCEWLKKLCRVQVYLRKEQVALTKMPRNKAKIYQKTDFLSTEGHLLTSSGCFLTEAYSGTLTRREIVRANASLGELRRDKEKLSSPISCELRRVKAS